MLSTGASFDIPFDPRTLSSIGTPGNRWRATAITFPPIEPTRASHFVSESTKAIFRAYSLEFNDIRVVEFPKRRGSVLRFNPLRTIIRGNSIFFWSSLLMAISSDFKLLFFFFNDEKAVLSRWSVRNFALIQRYMVEASQ